MSNVMKILPVGAELFHMAGQTGRQRDRQTEGRADRRTDRQTADMRKLTDAFRNFANSPKNKRKRNGRKKYVIVCLILVLFFAVKYTGYVWPLYQVSSKIYESITHSMWFIPLFLQ
jgi:hypothetical protein